MLAVDNSKIASNSIKLYNPFSIKAKLFKFAVYTFRFFLKYLPYVVKGNKSDFINIIEGTLGTEIISSIYYSTDRDKIVAQLQSKLTGEILCYLKVAITDVGNLKILNEIKAVNTLNNSGLIIDDYFQFSGSYNGFNYVAFRELPGEVLKSARCDIEPCLEGLIRDVQFPLISHPRIKSLQRQLTRLKQTRLLECLNEHLGKSQGEYSLTYEHGDFAPWNIVIINGRVCLFDFEYFVNDGLQYMDLFKYHFQVERLVKNKKPSEVIDSLRSLIHASEFEILLVIFLIKEIVQEMEFGNDCQVLEEYLRVAVEK